MNPVLLIPQLIIWNVFIMVGFVNASFKYTTTTIHCEDPKPVTDLAVTIISHTSFKLTWNGPSNVVENCVHGYNVTITADNGSEQQSYSVWHNYYINDDYQPFVPTLCTNYTATVFVEGYPGFSNTSSIRFYIGPAKVRSLVASNTTSTQTYLSWKKPLALTCAKHYKLYQCAYDAGSTDEEECTYKTEIVPLTANSTILRGLNPCKKHQIRLATVDNYGGESFLATTIHTGSGYPPIVPGVTSANNQGYSVTVSWPTHVRFNPQCHGGYVVCSISERDGSEKCFFTNKNSLEVKQLTACTSYTIRVQTVDGELKEGSRRSVPNSLRVFTNPQIPATTVEASSGERAILTFGNPDSFAVSCLRNYEMVECLERPSTGECQVLHNYTLPVNTTSFNSTKLTGCATSHMRIYAVADNGGKSYLDLKFINEKGTLQPPSKLSVVSANTKELSLAWTPPEFNECPHSYRVCVYLNKDKICANSNRETGDIFGNFSMRACYKYTAKVWEMYKKDVSSTIDVTFLVGPENAAKQMLEVTPTSALLTWQRDISSRRCNIGYSITWCPAFIFSGNCGQTPTGNIILPSNTTHYNISGLQICGKYLIVFQTLGSNDSLSEPNATVIQTPVTEFSAITDLTIHQQEDNTVVLDIVFPNNSTNCITKFTTCLYETVSENPEKYCRLMRTTWVNKTTQFCTNYTVDITAITYNKLTSNGSTTFLTRPSEVKDIAIGIVGIDSVNMTWINPGKKAISCVEYLEVKYNPEDSSGPAVEVRIPANSTSILLEALSNCTTYSFQIQAVAEEGIRSPLVFKKFTSTWDVLEKVQLLVTNTSNCQFFVSWQPPEHSICVISYQICWNSEDTGNLCEISTTNNWTSSESEVLQSCTRYNVSVAALDRYNRSSENVTTTFKTGPAVVTGVTVNISGTAVTVTWTYPRSNIICVDHHAVSFIRIQDDIVLARKNVSKEVSKTDIGDLEHCRRYKVEIQPIALNVTSPHAVFKHFHVPSNVESLTSLEVMAIDSSTLEVSYAIADVSSYCVGHFHICWASSSNKSCINKQGHTSSNITITGLSVGTNYTVEVTPVAPDGRRYNTTTTTANTLYDSNSANGIFGRDKIMHIGLLINVLFIQYRYLLRL